MKTSFATMATPGLAAEHSIEMAAKFGFDGIEFRVSDRDGELGLHSDSGRIKVIRDKLAKEQVQLSGLLCYNPTGSDNTTSWEDMGAYIKDALQLAKAVEAPSIRIFCKVPETPEKEHMIAQSAEVLTHVLNADRTNVAVLIQNHRLHSSVVDSCEIIHRVNHPRLGLYLSPDHCVVQQEPLLKRLPNFLPLIRQLFVADLVMEENRPKDVLPGLGVVPLREVLQLFTQIRDEGWVTFKWEKMYHPELPPAEIALPAFIQYMSKYTVPRNRTDRESLNNGAE